MYGSKGFWIVFDFLFLVFSCFMCFIHVSTYMFNGLELLFAIAQGSLASAFLFGLISRLKRIG